MRKRNIQMSRKMLGNLLLYSYGSFSTADLYVGASFDFVEDQAMLDKQQGHSSSIYALLAICSPSTGWKSLLGSIPSERQLQFHGTLTVGKKGGAGRLCPSV